MPVNNVTVSVIAKDQTVARSDFSRSILFIGIKQSSGTATTQVLQENITSKEKVNTFFGRTSNIAQGINHVLDLSTNRATDHNLLLSGIGIDPVGTKATGSIELSGTATESSDITVQYGKTYTKTLSVSKGQTSVNVISNLVSLINADLDSFLVAEIDGSNTSLMNLEASVEGSWCSGFNIILNNLPSGITIASNTAMNGGNYTGLSDLSTLISSIEKKQFDSIVIDKTLFAVDSNLETVISQRYNVIQNKFLSGQAIFTTVGSVVSDFTNILEEEQFGIDIAIVNNMSTVLPFIVASGFALMKECRLILNFITEGIIDTPNGTGEAQNLKMVISDIDISDYFDIDLVKQYQLANDDLKSLKAKGFETIELNDNENQVILTGNQSTYILDSDGNVPDLYRINDIEKKMFCLKRCLNLLNRWGNKTPMLFDKSGLTNVISLNDALIETRSFLKTLNYKDENDVYYGILDDSEYEAMLTKMESIITIAFNTYNSRTLNINDMMITINKAIENIIATVKFN